MRQAGTILLFGGLIGIAFGGVPWGREDLEDPFFFLKGRLAVLSSSTKGTKPWRWSPDRWTSLCSLCNPLGCALLLFAMNPTALRPGPSRAAHHRDPLSGGTSDGDAVFSLSSWLRRSLVGLIRQDPAAPSREKTADIFVRLNQARRDTSPFSEVLLAVLATATTMVLWRVGTRRFQTAPEIPAALYKPSGRRLKGHIVAVNDSDNLRFYHPAWLSRWWRAPHLDRGQLKTETLNIRLAGIDAPEMGHFGGTPQPFAAEAKEWLTQYTMGRQASLKVHRLDQYSRAVATVWVRRWFFLHKNVSLEMVKAGYATVYTGAGAEYGTAKEQLVRAEKWARRCRRGMWRQNSSEYVSPAEYKRQLRAR